MKNYEWFTLLGWTGIGMAVGLWKVANYKAADARKGQ